MTHSCRGTTEALFNKAAFIIAIMKILESQNAILSNAEFYQFITEREKTRDRAPRRPANHDKLIREVILENEP